MNAIIFALIAFILVTGSAGLVQHEAVAPAYAFDGAYAVYAARANVTEETNGVTSYYFVNGSVTYTFLNVSLSSRTYSLYCSTSGNSSQLGLCPAQVLPGSYTSPAFFLPVVGTQNLSELNAGTVPRGFLGYNGSAPIPEVLTNQSYSSDIGSYPADLVAYGANQSGVSLMLKVWVDMKTGAILQLQENYGYNVSEQALLVSVSLTMTGSNFLVAGPLMPQMFESVVSEDTLLIGVVLSLCLLLLMRGASAKATSKTSATRSGPKL